MDICYRFKIKMFFSLRYFMKRIFDFFYKTHLSILNFYLVFGYLLGYLSCYYVANFYSFFCCLFLQYYYYFILLLC